MRWMLGSCLVAVTSLAAAQAHWPQFRGADATGVSAAARLPDTWSTTENVQWVKDIPGKAWSSPVVWKDRVFVTTVASDKKADPPRKGLYIEDLKGKTSKDEHRWIVFCFDLATGKPLWEQTVHRGVPPGPVHIKNSHGSPTPATDGERLVVYFPDIGVFGLDLDGNVHWTYKIDRRATRLDWGHAASPALHKGRVYLVCDNDQESFMVALDAKTGKERWKIGRPEKSNWATPFVWEHAQRTEIVTAGTGKVRSYDLEGKLLWELGGMSSISIPTPFAAEGMLFVTSGYVQDQNRPVFAIRPGAQGDITLKKEEDSNMHVVWRQPQAGPYHPSPVVYNGHIYVLLDRGFLTCYDALTGKEVYGRQRLGPGAFTASPWACDGKIYCLSEEGETVVVQAGPQFKVLARNTLDEMSLATPALAGNRLLLRTFGKLYCIGGK